MRYGKHINSPTHQTQAIHGRESEMSKNDAGGYSFDISIWKQLQRFLIIGTEGGSYYVDERKHTLRNLTSLNKCIAEDGERVVREAIDISDQGRALKNDQAIFALASVMKLGNDRARKLAYESVSKICRTGTHLFSLAQALSDLNKGWGRGLKRAVANWYLEKDTNSLAFQVAKYQSRNKWSNRDLLRLAHPKTTDSQKNSVLKWVTNGTADEKLPPILVGFEKAKRASSAKELIPLVKEYSLPRECIPTTFLSDPDVNRALLEKMPLTALIRNLGNLTRYGVLTPTSDETQLVISRLTNATYIRKSRVHPIAILLALKIYERGQGEKGSGTWKPVPKIVSSLDKAFYMAFKNIEPTGKKFLIGIDVSGSMSWSNSSGNGLLTACETAAAVAMCIMRSEPRYYCYGFSDRFVDLGLNDSMSLTDVMKKTSSMNFGATDMSLPMIHALQNKLDVDVFLVITDGDTYMGNIHPSEALQKYRKEMKKPNAKMVMISTRAGAHSIADPNDLGSLDIVGFDAAVPQVLAEFAKE